MYCKHCGFIMSDNAEFCSKCGNKKINTVSNDVKMVSLRCTDCGGVMNVNDSTNVTMCPYCGSKNLLIESDQVKIEKIKSNERRDVEIHRQEISKTIDLEKIKNADDEKKRNDKMLVWLCIFVAFGWLVLVFM